VGEKGISRRIVETKKRTREVNRLSPGTLDLNNMRLLRFLRYRVIKKLVACSRLQNSSGLSECLVWPPLRHKEEARWLSRWLSWYIPPQVQLDITVPIEGNKENLIRTALSQNSTFASNVTLVQGPITAQHFATLLLRRATISESIQALWRFNSQLQIIDNRFWDVEESLAFEHIFRTQPTPALMTLRARLAEISVTNYRQLFQSYTGSRRAFIFGTGPSLQKALAVEFQPDDLTIACNSMVKDRELLAHIRPKILTFADQVFHFGPSNYAAAFRRDALQMLQEYRCKCIMPLDRAMLFALHHPEIAEYLIAIPFGSTLNFPTPEHFFVQPTENIMTLFMVPVASALAKEVYFCGADGRQPNERYFWRHDSKAQYHSLMDDAFEWHPSFFRDRRMGTYYDKHCETLERQLRYGESQGIRYMSLTPSQIPTLATRYDGPRPTDSTSSR